jgi:hypothetical protein
MVRVLPLTAEGRGFDARSVQTIKNVSAAFPLSMQL